MMVVVGTREMVVTAVRRTTVTDGLGGREAGCHQEEGVLGQGEERVGGERELTTHNTWRSI